MLVSKSRIINEYSNNMAKAKLFINKYYKYNELNIKFLSYQSYALVLCV